MPIPTLHDEIANFETRYPDTAWVDLFTSDINGNLVGKRLPFAKLRQVANNGLRLPPASLACDIEGETVNDTGFGNDRDGDADLLCRLVPGTLANVPWAQIPTAQMFIAMQQGDTPFMGQPRAVLQHVIDEFSAHGLTPVVAVELEFYLVDAIWRKKGRLIPPCAPRSGRRLSGYASTDMLDVEDFEGLLSAMVDAAHEQGVPATTILSEYGPGQFEINLDHRPDAMRAADEGILLKRIVKAVATKEGFGATFMAKPYSEFSGSGLHVHVSILDEAGNNIFEAMHGENHLHHAIAGMIGAMRASTLIFAPTLNSYRRLQNGILTAERATWAENNRNAAIRVIREGAGATRIEHRVAGADAQVHLVVAAILASILHGLEAKAPAPAPLHVMNYDDLQERIPTNWQEALAQFARSDWVCASLGKTIHDMIREIKKFEFEKFTKHIPKEELLWYFDRA